jgi:hypothetical protein
MSLLLASFALQCFTVYFPWECEQWWVNFELYAHGTVVSFVLTNVFAFANFKWFKENNIIQPMFKALFILSSVINIAYMGVLHGLLLQPRCLETSGPYTLNSVAVGLYIMAIVVAHVFKRPQTHNKQVNTVETVKLIL